MQSALMFFVSCLPVLWLILALGVFKMAAHKACLAALAGTLVIAFFRGLSFSQLVSGTAEGFANALWPICLVIIAALFCYNLCVKTGAMEKIKMMLGGISTDRRVLILLVGWGFGNFMEGMAGFGTAVAIPASMLAGIGLDPLRAVLVCLIGNTTPTAFGSVGVPAATLASVTGLDVVQLSKNIVCLQMLHTLVSPFLMVFVGGGFKALKETWKLTAVAAFAFVFPWSVAAWFLGPELPNIIGSICSMAAVVATVKLFKKQPSVAPAGTISFAEGLRAWCPFVFVTVFLTLASRLCPPVCLFLKKASSSFQIYSGEGANTISFDWLNTPGVLIFAAAVLGGFFQRATAGEMLRTLAGTIRQYSKTVLTICCVMGVAKLMSYSGMTGNIASTLVALAGTAFPVISPWIGSVGALVTGSGTSTCVLFGELQKDAAETLRINPEWTAAANLFGAGIGKMICPQSIAIGAGAIGLTGSESEILRAVIKFFIVYALFAGAASFAACLIFE